MQRHIDRPCLQGSKSGAAVRMVADFFPQGLALNSAQAVVLAGPRTHRPSHEDNRLPTQHHPRQRRPHEKSIATLVAQ